MKTLILKTENKSRTGGVDWDENDSDVFEAGRCIERIFLSPSARSQAMVAADLVG